METTENLGEDYMCSKGAVRIATASVSLRKKEFMQRFGGETSESVANWKSIERKGCECGGRRRVAEDRVEE
jgi:hypothetical protein